MFTVKQILGLVITGVLLLLSVAWCQGYLYGRNKMFRECETWVIEYNLEKYKIPRIEVMTND